MSGASLWLPAAVVVVTACAAVRQYEPVWDADRDGNMDAVEFRAGMEQAWVFGFWDADGGGDLDAAEFQAGLTGRGARFAPANGYREWDRDGDGRLDRDEFYAGVFRELDLNGDGGIEGIELRIIGRGMGLPGIDPAPRETKVAKGGKAQ